MEPNLPSAIDKGIALGPAATDSSPVFNSAAMPRSRRHLEALTALRFFAAAFVMVGHMSTSPAAFNLRDGMLDSGIAGQAVAFFFMLSGFILTYVYPTVKRGGALRFFVARGARIWPMHLAAIVLLIALVVVKGDVILDPIVVTLNALLLQSWLPIGHLYGSFNPVAWSVSAELFFYLCFPLLIWNWQKTWYMKLLGSFAILCIMITLANYGVPFLPRGIDVSGLVYISPLAHIFEFTIGIATAHVFMEIRDRFERSGRARFDFEIDGAPVQGAVRARDRSGKPSLIGTALELAAIAVCLFSVAHARAWGLALGTMPGIGAAGAIWLYAGGIGLPAFALVLLILALEIGWVSRLLSLAPFVILGEISYSLYLIHFTFVGYYLFHQDLFRAIPDALLWPTFSIAVIAASYACWSLIEVPCRRAIVSWYDRRVPRGGSRLVARRPVAITRPWFTRVIANQPLRGTLAALLLAMGIGAIIHASAVPSSVSGLIRTTTGVRWAIVINGADPTTTPVRVSRGKEAALFGWAVDPQQRRPIRGALLSIDGRTDVQMEYGLASRDVATYLGDPRYLRASFIGTLPVSQLAPGDHVLTLRIFPLDRHLYFESHKFGITVE